MKHREKTLRPAIESLEPRELLSASSLGIPAWETSPPMSPWWQPSVGAAGPREESVVSPGVRAGNAAGVTAFGRPLAAGLGEAVTPQVRPSAAPVRARLAAQAGDLTPQDLSGPAPLRAGLFAAASVRSAVAGSGGSSVRSAIATLLVNAAPLSAEGNGIQEAWGSSWPDSFLPASFLPEPLTLPSEHPGWGPVDSPRTLPGLAADVSEFFRGSGGDEALPDNLLPAGLPRVAMGLKPLDSVGHGDTRESDAGSASRSRGAGGDRGEFQTADDRETWLRGELVDEHAVLRLPLKRHEPTTHPIGADTPADSDERPQPADVSGDQACCRGMVAARNATIRTLEIAVDESEPATIGMIAFVGSGAAGEGNTQGGDAARWLGPGARAWEGPRHKPILVGGLCGRVGAFEIETAAEAAVQAQDEPGRASAGEASASEAEIRRRRPGASAATRPPTVFAPEGTPAEATGVGLLSVWIVGGTLSALNRRTLPTADSDANAHTPPPGPRSRAD